MSAYTMDQVWAPIEAHYRAQVMDDTWGHLAPHKNKTYRGHVVLAIGCFGSDYLNPTVLVSDFPDLEDSPWFFEALTDFLNEGQNCSEPCRFETGGVYRFDGSFRNYVFRGKFSRLV